MPNTSDSACRDRLGRASARASIEVPTGTWVLFKPGWGFASSSEATDPPNYLEALLSGDVSFQMLLDGTAIPHRVRVVEAPAGAAGQRTEPPGSARMPRSSTGST